MLIPGFRFYPTDEELVMYHLQGKVLGKKRFQVIGEIYIYRYAPWDLPDRSLLRTGDLKWYFFCPIEKKYAGSVRRNRSTDLGCWTTSGKDRKVYHNSVVVGTIRSLIFYKGKSPNAERTDWVMHEYKLEGKEWAEKGIAQDMYVLCVIFNKDGLGPKNGAQYGAPFKEEDWDSEEEVELGDRHFSSIGASTLALATQDNPSTSHVPLNYAPEDMSVGQSTSCPLETLPPIHHTGVPDTNANAEASQIVAEDDDILGMLDMFLEESEFLAQKPENSDRVDSPNKVEGVQTDNFIDGNDFFEDLDNLAGLDQPESNAIPSGLPAAFYGEQTFPDDNLPYLELRDFDDPLNSLGGFDSIKQIDNNTEYTNNYNYESFRLQMTLLFSFDTHKRVCC
ncbi:hypothetical protein K2173_000910 [Erythroxylum novogranatense]|uniref:NAC domain-containing protein n=1 Tax=Erythroxylum novogranatense TaxID=1862640 RepID=A0AAV8TQC1_9ROSI|nr:hypothetical protein K2173_000910 [Erythroxylum novogranatense]